MVYRFFKSIDIDNFKNFIIYLNSQLIKENDKNKIFKILQYFIEEKNEVYDGNNDVFKSHFSIENPNEDNEKIIKNTNTSYAYENKQNVIDSNAETRTFIYSFDEAYDNDRNITINVDKDKKGEKFYKKEINFLDYKIISRNFIEHILASNLELKNEMLEKVCKKMKNSSSIIENVLFKIFIGSTFYNKTRNDSTNILPKYIKHECNALLTVKEQNNDPKIPNISLENEKTNIITNESIVKHQNTKNIPNKQLNFIKKNITNLKSQSKPINKTKKSSIFETNNKLKKSANEFNTQKLFTDNRLKIKEPNSSSKKNVKCKKNEIKSKNMPCERYLRNFKK
ncbi:hypothetical protein NAPIS_ORF02508 [Vairimorpha apis BRL 01]|uniref:Uncharacterized protein n=1 Tax=Vairimorpha apis BRL 01 TaxID=1037528 RepID=T0MFT7_9MICR|nr:hypothetical protein NAPIS_ORF02508 [Vairimorpha apis BRL 01]